MKRKIVFLTLITTLSINTLILATELQTTTINPEENISINTQEIQTNEVGNIQNDGETQEVVTSNGTSAIVLENVSYKKPYKPEIIVIPSDMIIKNEKNIQMVPLIDTATMLGFETSVDEETGVVTLTKDNLYTYVTPNNNNYVINKMFIPLEVAPTYIDEVLYVPVSFISEILHYETSFSENGDLQVKTTGKAYNDMHDNMEKKDQAIPIQIQVSNAPFTLTSNSNLQNTSELTSDGFTVTLYDPVSNDTAIIQSHKNPKKVPVDEQAYSSKADIVRSLNGQGSIVTETITKKINGYTFTGYKIVLTDENNIKTTYTTLFMNDNKTNITYSINTVAYGETLNKDIESAINTFKVI